MHFQWQQLKEMLAVALSTAKKKGRVNNDEAVFVETILMAVAADMTLEEVDLVQSLLEAAQEATSYG
jgi:hypothetical protein